MIFTQEMIEEIRDRLTIMGTKDTDLSTVDLIDNPLNGEETFVIVKDGRNIRVPLDSLIAAINIYVENEQHNNKPSDFFNVSAYMGLLDPEYHGAAKPTSLTEAINACPAEVRKAGQYISFVDRADGKWKTYQMISTENEDWVEVSKFFNPFKDLQKQIEESLTKIEQAIAMLSPEQQQAIGIAQEVVKLKNQLHGYSLLSCTESEYNQMILDDEIDENTLYFIEEEEEEPV